MSRWGNLAAFAYARTVARILEAGQWLRNELKSPLARPSTHTSISRRPQVCGR